jgi:hypothetical protein
MKYRLALCILIIARVFIFYQCSPEEGCCQEPSCRSASINFSQMEIYKNNSLIFTYNLLNLTSLTCDLGSLHISFPDNTPDNIRAIYFYWNADETAFDSVEIVVAGQNIPATIDGTLDTFTEISGGQYRIVPIRP